MSYRKYNSRIFVNRRLQEAYDSLDQAFLYVEESEHGANGNMTLDLKIESLLRQLAAREACSKELYEIWTDESDKRSMPEDVDEMLRRSMTGEYDLSGFVWHRHVLGAGRPH